MTAIVINFAVEKLKRIFRRVLFRIATPGIQRDYPVLFAGTGLFNSPA